MRRSGLALLVVAALAALPAEAKDWKRLRIAVDGAYPPFSSVTAEGKPAGFDPEVANALCARLAATCDLVTTGWDGLLPALLANRVDLIVASQPITEDGLRRVGMTQKYHQILPRFVSRDVAEPPMPSPATAKGKRIGVRGGTAHAAWLAATYKPRGAEIVDFASEADALAALAAGRIDLVFGDTLVLFDWLDRDPRGKGCRFVGKGVDAPRFFGAGAGIAFRPEDRDLGALVDRALADLDRDGTLDRLAGHWFPFAVR